MCINFAFQGSLFVATYLISFISEWPDVEVKGLNFLLNKGLWTDPISLTIESGKEVCNYAWDITVT